MLLVVALSIWRWKHPKEIHESRRAAPAFVRNAESGYALTLTSATP